MIEIQQIINALRIIAITSVRISARRSLKPVLKSRRWVDYCSGHLYSWNHGIPFPITIYDTRCVADVLNSGWRFYQQGIILEHIYRLRLLSLLSFVSFLSGDRVQWAYCDCSRNRLPPPSHNCAPNNNTCPILESRIDKEAIFKSIVV